MIKNISNIIILNIVALFVTSTAFAQQADISAELVQSLLTGKRNIALIDVRMPDEYLAGHIPGAVNIPAQRILADRNMLPKDRSTRIIFYCRGVG